jgi:hypothetical protein
MTELNDVDMSDGKICPMKLMGWLASGHEAIPGEEADEPGLGCHGSICAWWDAVGAGACTFLKLTQVTRLR